MGGESGGSGSPPLLEFERTVTIRQTFSSMPLCLFAAMYCGLPAIWRKLKLSFALRWKTARTCWSSNGRARKLILSVLERTARRVSLTCAFRHCCVARCSHASYAFQSRWLVLGPSGSALTANCCYASMPIETKFAPRLVRYET